MRNGQIESESRKREKKTENKIKKSNSRTMIMLNFNSDEVNVISCRIRFALELFSSHSHTSYFCDFFVCATTFNKKSQSLPEHEEQLFCVRHFSFQVSSHHMQWHMFCNVASVFKICTIESEFIIISRFKHFSFCLQLFCSFWMRL